MKHVSELKEWYSLEDAAKRLTDNLNEQVTAEDIVQLALSNHLRLSWCVVNKFAGSVTPVCKLIDRVGPEYSAQWSEFEGTVKWSAGYAYRNRKRGQISEPFASLNCLPIDLSPKKFVSGLFRFHPEYHDTHDWLSMLLNGGGGVHKSTNWNLGGGIYLSDDAGQMWDFLDRVAVSRLEGESLAELEARLDRICDLPRYSQILVQRIDIEAFEDGLTGADMDMESSPIPMKDAPHPIGAMTREKNTLLKIIGLMMNQRYSKDIGAPYTIAALLLDKARELDIRIGKEAIANHLKSALDLLESKKSDSTS